MKKKITVKDTKRDEEIEARLVTMMREHPANLIIYFLAICGRTMEETNAETMEVSTEATFNKKRYKVTGKMTIKGIPMPCPPAASKY